MTITVKPDYTQTGVERSMTFKNPPDNAGARYPVDVAGHRVQLQYDFRDSQLGVKLASLKYRCRDCGHEAAVEHQKLCESDDVLLRRVRRYLLGEFVETECE